MKLVQRSYKLFCRVKSKILLKEYMRKGKIETLEITPDFAWLEKKWPMKDSHCYAALSVKQVEKTILDLAIIVPLYNSEKYIDTCVKQLMEQKTKFNYEVILVNDGSKDNTLMLAYDYQKRHHDKILVIDQDNQGISSARNAGIRSARSKYLAFVDHDDYVSEYMVERLMSVAYVEDADIVKSAFVNIIHGKKKSVQEGVDDVIQGEMKEKLFAFRSYVFPGVYRRSLFENISFPTDYWYEDMIIRTLIYRQANKFVHISDVLYYKHFHKNNASFVIWKTDNYKCLEQLYLVLSMIEANKKLGLKEDVWFYQCILRELSILLPQRIRGLDTKTKQMAFLKACEIVNGIYREEYFELLTKDNKLWHRVFLNKEYKLWLLMSGYY